MKKPPPADKGEYIMFYEIIQTIAQNMEKKYQELDENEVELLCKINRALHEFREDQKILANKNKVQTPKI